MFYRVTIIGNDQNYAFEKVNFLKFLRIKRLIDIFKFYGSYEFSKAGTYQCFLIYETLFQYYFYLVLKYFFSTRSNFNVTNISLVIEKGKGKSVLVYTILSKFNY